MTKEIITFAAMASLISGGGNEGAVFPIDDATDFANGARYSPGEVTDARRRGERVIFDADAHQWRMPDGELIPKGGSQYARTPPREMK